MTCEAVKAGHSPTVTPPTGLLPDTGARVIPPGPAMVPPGPVVVVTWAVVVVVPADRRRCSRVGRRGRGAPRRRRGRGARRQTWWLSSPRPAVVVVVPPGDVVVVVPPARSGGCRPTRPVDREPVGQRGRLGLARVVHGHRVVAGRDGSHHDVDLGGGGVAHALVDSPHRHHRVGREVVAEDAQVPAGLGQVVGVDASRS